MSKSLNWTQFLFPLLFIISYYLVEYPLNILPESTKMEMNIIEIIGWINHSVCIGINVWYSIEMGNFLNIRHYYTMFTPIHFELENRECLFWQNKTPATNKLHPSIVLSEFNVFQRNNECRYFCESPVHSAKYRVRSITISTKKCYSICNLCNLIF